MSLAEENVRTGPLEVPLRIEASGSVPVAVAWQRYELPSQWPTWSPQLRSVTLEQPTAKKPAPTTGPVPATDRPATAANRLAAGLTGQVHGPLGVSAGFTVLDLDVAARRWSWLVRFGPLAVRLEHGVDQRTDGEPGSRTWLVLHGPAPIVLGYAPVAWYALHRLVTLPA